MADLLQNASLQGTCRSGGLWYTCTAQSRTFLGCCTSNPCNGQGCPASDLRAASLGLGAGPDACVNDSSFWPYTTCPSGYLWYTCLKTNPSFQGCCSINPCTSGSCPQRNLAAASFSADLPSVVLDDSKGTCAAAPSSTTQSAGTISTGSLELSSTPVVSSKSTSNNVSVASSIGPTGTIAISSVSTSQAVTTTNAIGPTGTIAISSVSTSQAVTTTNANGATITTIIISQVPASTSTPAPAVVGSGPSIPAIAGGAAGGVVALILIIAALFWNRRRHRSQQVGAFDNGNPESHAQTHQVFPKNDHEEYYKGNGPISPTGFPAPPPYKHQPSPNTGYGPDEVHEISTSNTHHPASTSDGHGLGLREVYEAPLPESQYSPQFNRENRSSELSGISSPTMSLPNSGEGRFTSPAGRQGEQRYSDWQAYSP